MKNEKVLYATNVNRIQDVELNLNYCQKLIQSAIDEFNKIAPITINQLEGLFDQYHRVDLDKLDEFLRSELVKGKAGIIQGLEIDTEKLKELIILPDATDLIKILSEFANTVESKTITAPDTIYWQFYSIDKNNKVKISSDALDILTQSFKFYASTPEEIQRLNNVTKLREAVNAFCASNPEINKEEVVNHNLLAVMNDDFIINPTFIEMGRI